MFLSNSLSLLPLDLWWEEKGLLLLGLSKGAAPAAANVPAAPTSASQLVCYHYVNLYGLCSTSFLNSMPDTLSLIYMI